MTAEDILPILTRWAEAITAIDEAMDHIREAVGVEPEAPLPTAINDLIGLANDWAAVRIGTSLEWMEWFWLENEMGARGHQAGQDGNLRPIRTLEDFAKLLADDIVAADEESK